jgi:hypothetical protein
VAWNEKYVSVSGAGAADGSSAANAWTLAGAISGVAAGDRVNVLAGTYANATTNRTFGTAGSTTAPIWWRGYNTTIGDCDVDPTLARPEITFTTGLGTFSGAWNIFSSLNFSSTRTSAAAFTVGATAASPQRFIRCRFANTGNNANAHCFLTAGSASSRIYLHECHVSAHASANFVSSGPRAIELTDCVVESGITLVNLLTSAGMLTAARTIFRGCSSHGVIQTISSAVVLYHCTFYDIGGDGVRWTAAPAVGSSVERCVFSSVGGYGVNNSTGTNTGNVILNGNLYHSVTSGQTNGFGDWPDLGALTDASSPFADAAGGDYSLAFASAGRAVESIYENLTTTSSYPDTGAVQHYEPTDAEIAQAVWEYADRTLTG